MKNKHIGSSLSSFLDEEGIREDVDLRAKKKIIADQMRAKMQRDGVTVAGLARRMNTSRTVVIRLLDPNDTGFTFTTLVRASHALGMNLRVSLAVQKHLARRGEDAARLPQARDGAWIPRPPSLAARTRAPRSSRQPCQVPGPSRKREARDRLAR